MKMHKGEVHFILNLVSYKGYLDKTYTDEY